MDKYLKTKRKCIDDDLDDSFDFFLPNKLKEKSILNQNDGKSRNNSSRRKKASPSSSSLSSFSQETYDSDIDRVMSICMTKNESIEYSAIPKSKEINANWKELTSKMKPRHPLLLKRTAAEREAILSQKLALILVNEDDKSNSDCFSLIDMEEIIQSNLLIEQWCKTCRLWSAAKKPSEKLKTFYITTFTNYIEFDLNEETEICIAQKNENLHKNLEKSENLSSDNDEEVGFPLTQKIIEEMETEKSCIDIFDSYNVDKSSENNVESCENVSPYKADDNAQIGDKRVLNETVAVFHAEPNIIAESPDIVTLSSPASSSSSVVNNLHPFECNYPDSQRTVSPVHSSSTVNAEISDSKVSMLDRIGLTLLAEQWNNLFNKNDGDITVFFDNEETLNVHKIVLTVRCPSLISEITEDNKIIWKMYSLDVGKAFFRYVYSGKCDHLWNLTSLEKNSFKRLARIHHLSHLEEVLNKFHRFRNESDSSDVELKNILEKCDKIKSKSFDHLSAIIESSEHCEMIMSKSYETSDYATKTSKEYLTPLKSDNEANPNFSYLENECAKNVAGESIAISSESDKEQDANEYDYNFRYPSSPLQDRQSTQNVSSSKKSPTFVRKSLEAFFQDSFPEIPTPNHSFSQQLTGYPTQSDGNMPDENIHNTSISLSDSDESDKLSFQASIISSSSVSNSPVKSTTGSPTIDQGIFHSLPSTSTALSPNKISQIQNTPSTSTNSEIIFSKNVTPFPNYDEMITPQLKKELKKYGLKSDLRSTKAKLILKYIYDQTHPIIESSESLEKEVSSDDQPTMDNSVKNGTLVEMIMNLVRNNEEIYNHILQFKPIWLEEFYNVLKENGIRCSINDLKDVLNELCITYRANNTTRNTSKKPTRKKNSKKARNAIML